MSEHQPWLGMCHLTKQEGETPESYQAIAAVFCGDRETYDKLLHKYLEPKGYHLFWSEEVHPAGQWITRFPQDRSAAGLARAVHPHHLIEVEILRTVTQKAEETEAAQQAEYLSIEETKGVEPLDLQIGADVRKTIPDALFAPIFDQSSPAEDEIKHHVSSENLPSLGTYAILDAAKVQFLTTYLEESGLPYKCLFKGNTERCGSLYCTAYPR